MFSLDDLRNFNFASFDQKFLVKLGVSAGIVIFIFLFLLMPSCRRLSGLRSDKDTVANNLTQARVKIGGAIHIENNRESLYELIKLAESRFFSADEITDVLGIISEVGKKHNLTLIASRPVEADNKSETPTKVMNKQHGKKGPPPSAADFYEPHKHELSFSGGYHALGTFLSGLKRAPKHFQVESLSVEPTNDPLAHEIRMEIVVYAKKSGVEQ